MSENNPLNNLDRRRFLQGAVKSTAAVVLAPGLFVPESLLDQVRSWISPKQSKPIKSPVEKTLSFYNRHTGESLKKCTFWAEGHYIKEGLREIKTLFRDHRTGQSQDIDRDLLRLLHSMMEKLESKGQIHLISGYRSPKTNRLLCSKSKGVARTSQHLLGKAADIVVPGCHLRDVQKVAKSLGVGGVGRYADFVHVDTGRKRYWGMA